MSHIASIELVINDLKTLAKACNRLGIIFLQGKKNYRWYGSSWNQAENVIGNYVPGQCDHVIQVPGADYEIGVIKDGENFALVADFWQYGGLEEVVGPNAGKLKQAYAVERVKNEAKQKRMRIQEVMTENSIRLVLTA